MAKRKGSKNKRRSRRSRGLNAVDFAETLLLTNAGTKAIFGTTVGEFFLEGTLINPQSSLYGNSDQITMRELIQGLIPGGKGFGMGATFGTGKGNLADLSTAIQANIAKNGVTSLIQAVTIPLAFRIGKRLTSKPRASMNRLLKDVGIKNMVRV